MDSFAFAFPAAYVLGGTSVFAFASLYAFHLYLSIQRPGEPRIRWSSVPLLGYALELGKRPIDFLQECAALSDGIFGIVIGGKRMFIITDPFSTQTVLKPETKHLSSAEFHDAVQTNFFGCGGPVIHETDNNLARRWYSQYLLSDKALLPLSQRMHARLNELSYNLKIGNVGLRDLLGEFIFRASMGALFNDAASRQDGLFEHFQTFDKLLPLALAGMPSSLFPDAIKGRATLVQACRDYTEGLSDFMQTRHDYFSNLEKTGKILSGDTARVQVIMVWASASNTMPAGFWMLYFLMKNPDYMKRALVEVDALVKTAGSIEGPWTQEQIDSLSFLDACFTEALRLSSGSLIMRGCTAPCEITLNDGRVFKLRKGDRVGLCPPLFHLDSDFFPEPNSFKPERWLDADGHSKSEAAQGKMRFVKNGKEIASSAVFLPFGAGISLCPGRRFARNEVKILVTLLLSRFTFAFADGESGDHPGIDGSRAGLGIFPPGKEIQVMVTRR
jgi:cytochrome P450